MNLLPIIYSSLIIFTSFVVFVVIISYITYKIKEKNRVNYQTSAVDLTANYIEKTPSYSNQNFQTQYSYSQAPIIKTEPKRKVNYYNNETHTRYDLNSSRSHLTRQTIEMPRISRNNYVPNIDFSARHRTTQVNKRNRFDILNGQPAVQTGSASFGSQEYDFLNYYANDDEIHSTQSYAKVS